MIHTRIKSRPRGRTKKYNPTLWTRTLYRVLVSYEHLGKEGWETVEEPILVEGWNPDDVHTEAFNRIAKTKMNVEIKSVTELSQAEYMRFIGAPELFAMAA